MADMSQKTQQAMETAIAGATEVSRYGRRIVKMIWDPQPHNDRALNRPVWCLGCSYTHEPTRKRASSPESPTPAAIDSTPTRNLSVTAESTPTNPAPCTLSNSTSSSVSSSRACDEPSVDGGWPVTFLDDFESRIWLTYRSGFEPIPRSTDPKASAALSFAMRLKTLGDQTGFSSDTGWGCMIRSGQSLLANSLSICQLGRGKPFPARVRSHCTPGANH